MSPEIIIIILPIIKKTMVIELKISKNPPAENNKTPTNINCPFNLDAGSSKPIELLANKNADNKRTTFKKIIYDNINNSYSESTMLIILPINDGSTIRII